MTAELDPYRTYLTVCEAVRRIKARETLGAAMPSAYWADELSNIDYMIEASPLIVRKLRHHTFHITGVRPYDYRADDGRREAFERRLRTLVELGGRDLLVPEHEALGGFGYRFADGLFNLDTIKFFEVLVGMRRAGILSAFEGPAPVVLEIGAGWGGFAYQVKTLFPRVSYVIVDFPELFLFSATYLQTVLPHARIVIAGEDSDSSEWQGADFVFVPTARADRVRHVVPDVTVNIASFQEMTADQVDLYASLASDAGSQYLYSLNRERSRYNGELSSVSKVVGRYYDVKEIAILEDDYTKAVKKPSKTRSAKDSDSGDDWSYHHLVGERRAMPVRASRALSTFAKAERKPIVSIGATLYNRAEYLREALDSLLAQTFTDFHLVLVDDASTDGTESIAREYAARDPRVTYVKHRQRRGMTATWRAAFEAATRPPSVRYFAWASDHDRWDPQWLERLVAEMDANPALVLAYPFTRRIDPEGRLLAKPPRLFETAGMHSLKDRWPYVCRETVAAGDMIYGVMRVDAARHAGVFRDVLCPDRLLIAELALQGEFRQVREDLWYRRQFAGSSVSRQRGSLFAARAPRGRWLPPWLQHGRALWRVYVAGEPDRGRRRVNRGLVLQYVAHYALRHQQKATTYRQFGAVLRGVTWTRKRLKHYSLLALFHALVSTRRAYHKTVYEVAIFTRRIGLR